MPIVNRLGLNFDGSTSHLSVGKLEIPYISISYGDSLDAEWVYRAGTQVAEADTPGQYKTEDGSLKVSAVNARAILLPALPVIGAANLRAIAIVNFIHPEIGTDSDLLEGFRFTGLKASIEAGAKGLEVEVKFRYRLVKWTEARVCLGNTFGTGVAGTARI